MKNMHVQPCNLPRYQRLYWSNQRQPWYFFNKQVPKMALAFFLVAPSISLCGKVPRKITPWLSDWQRKTNLGGVWKSRHRVERRTGAKLSKYWNFPSRGDGRTEQSMTQPRWNQDDEGGCLLSLTWEQVESLTGFRIPLWRWRPVNQQRLSHQQDTTANKMTVDY